MLKQTNRATTPDATELEDELIASQHASELDELIASKLSAGEFVANEHTFEQALSHDLRRATALVIMQAPYLTQQGVLRFAAPLNECIRHGIRVCMFVQEPSFWKNPPPEVVAERHRFKGLVKYLRRIGVHVTLRAEIHVKVALIDNKIFWDGSLNMMSYKIPIKYEGKPDNERSTRLVNSKLLQEAIEMHRLDGCLACAKIAKNRAVGDEVVLNENNLGALIAYRRNSIGMRQEDLAERTGIHKQTLSKIESDRQIPSYKTLIKLWRELGLDVGTHLPHTTAALEEMMRRDRAFASSGSK